MLIWFCILHLDNSLCLKYVGFDDISHYEIVLFRFIYVRRSARIQADSCVNHTLFEFRRQRFSQSYLNWNLNSTSFHEIIPPAFLEGMFCNSDKISNSWNSIQCNKPENEDSMKFCIFLPRLQSCLKIFLFFYSYLATLGPPNISFSSISFCKSVSSLANSFSKVLIFSEDATLYSSKDVILADGWVWFYTDGWMVWTESVGRWRSLLIYMMTGTC